MKPKPKDIPEEELEKLIANAQATKDYKICGYVSVMPDGTLKVCKYSAGAGTPHPGVGRCKFHGGVGRPMTTGRQLVYKTDGVKTLLDKARELHVKQVEDHMESLRLATAIVEELASTSTSTSTLDPTRIEVLRRVLETKIKAEELQIKRQEKDVLTFDEIAVMLSNILAIIDEEVKDINIKRRIFSKIKDITIIRRGKQNERQKEENTGS